MKKLQNKKFEYVDDNPGAYFGMLCEGYDRLNEGFNEDEDFSIEVGDVYSNNNHTIEIVGELPSRTGKPIDTGKFLYRLDGEDRKLSGQKSSIYAMIRNKGYSKLSKEESLKEDKFVPKDKISKKDKKELDEKANSSEIITDLMGLRGKLASLRKEVNRLMDEKYSDDKEVLDTLDELAMHIYDAERTLYLK